jgi:lysophospholipase L1-like esterase
MGSSFAAGPGLPTRVPGSPRRAGRSTGNYAHLLARALGLDLHDVTFSGATTGDLLRPSAGGQPAQLAAVTPDTALVTITAGGNDVGYVPRLTLASLPWPLRALPPLTAQVAKFGDGAATDERFAQLRSNLAEIAQHLRDQAPACRVLIVDYLTILPPDGQDSGPPPPVKVKARALQVTQAHRDYTQDQERAHRHTRPAGGAGRRRAAAAGRRCPAAQPPDPAGHRRGRCGARRPARRRSVAGRGPGRRR